MELHPSSSSLEFFTILQFINRNNCVCVQFSSSLNVLIIYPEWFCERFHNIVIFTNYTVTASLTRLQSQQVKPTVKQDFTFTAIVNWCVRVYVSDFCV